MKKQKTVTYFAEWLNRELAIPVVEKIPADHVVWNIGRNTPAGHVLICRCKGFDVIEETTPATTKREQGIKK